MSIERTFAWIDKFRTLVTRYERKDVYWLGFHLIAFTLDIIPFQDNTFVEAGMPLNMRAVQPDKSTCIIFVAS